MTGYVGQQFGNYRLIGLLGRGAFAEVYLGQHLYLEMQRAVKILNLHLTEEAIATFNHEAQTLAALIHPHIVRITDSDVEHAVPFLVMDYAPNGSLRQRHPKGERVPLPTIVSYVKQMADALQYAHNRQVVHCDVKPENMLLGQHDEVLLSDFGIAVIAQNPSSFANAAPQKAFGTIPYMAPEHIDGHPCPASDQYALGIVVYEWLCGERPFDGSHTEIVAQHLMTPPPSLRKKVPILAPDVEKVVFKALAKDPIQRFANVQMFADELERASLLPPPPRLSRRAVVLSLAALGLSAAVGVGVTAMLSKAPSAGPPPAPTSTGPTPTFTREASPTPTQVTGPLLYTYRGHSDNVNAVAWSPDGQYIASGSEDGAVQVWHADNGGYAYTFHLPQFSSANVVAWSPNGKRIASSGVMAAVQIWNAFDGGDLFTYGSASIVPLPLAWSSDGMRIASAEDWMVHVWNAANGENYFTYYGHSHTSLLFVETVTWSPGGKYVASGSDDTTVQVWDAPNGGHIYTYRGHSHSVSVAAWSPDGKRIASGSYDGTVQVWDALNGGHVYTYRGHSGHVKTLAWSPDGRRIVSGGDDVTVHVWDASNGKHLYLYHGYQSGVNAVAWSPDGKRIAIGSDVKTVDVWQAL